MTAPTAAPNPTARAARDAIPATLFMPLQAQPKRGNELDDWESDDEVLDGLEVDLEVAECGEILEAHGVSPTPDLVVALWQWKQGGST